MCRAGCQKGGLRAGLPACRCSPSMRATWLRSRSRSSSSRRRSSRSFPRSAWAASRRRSSEASEARWLAGTGAVADLPVASRRWWIWSRMSGWEYSQERDTPACPATAAKVAGVPARSSSRIAWIALALVSSCRRLAAAMIGPVLSARIGDVLLRVVAGLQGGDDALQVAGDLLVHLSHPRLPAGFGGGDDLQGLLVLLAVLREELFCGDEQRACEACVGVFAPLDQRQAAVAVGQRLGG